MTTVNVRYIVNDVDAATADALAKATAAVVTTSNDDKSPTRRPVTAGVYWCETQPTSTQRAASRGAAMRFGCT